jgi:single-stranded-DNA-specific exonuclease
MLDAISDRFEDQPDIALSVDSSALNRRWIWRTSQSVDSLAYTQRFGVPEVVGRLMSSRGIPLDAAEDFLNPTLRRLLPNPSNLIDMDVASDRIASAVRNAETVAIFGDYDVDGASSAALMVDFLRGLGCSVMHYVPDRLKEGYGPNGPALVSLHERGASLIITVDCGIAAADAIGKVAGRCDVIVLDHHKAEGPPPPALATVNPNRLDCPSKLHYLCATAVAFLAAVAVCRTLRRSGFFTEDRGEPNLVKMLDLVALATICDMMPLQGVNRAFVIQGLKIMAKRERPGLAALMSVIKENGIPTSKTLGFGIGPRINAAGRIDECDLGVRLLTCEDTIDAMDMAERLDSINKRRQEVEAGVLDAAIETAAAQLEAGHACILIANEGWHPGIVGIVAGRVKERFNRPALIAGIIGETAKGSGRSVTGLDLGAAIIAARQTGLLLSGGGHAMAAGFSCKASDIERLHAFLDSRLIKAKELPAAADLLIDGALTTRGANAELADEIDKLSPFGGGNDEPTFVVQDARIVKADRIGEKKTTIRVFVEGQDGGRLKGIIFRATEGPMVDLLLNSQRRPVHLAGKLRNETWNDTKSATFYIEDGCPSGWAI